MDCVYSKRKILAVCCPRNTQIGDKNGSNTFISYYSVFRPSFLPSKTLSSYFPTEQVERLLLKNVHKIIKISKSNESLVASRFFFL